jgi:hypothetical protein
MMTCWEAEQRCSVGDRAIGWNEEWVGMFVRYPVRRLELSVRFPESLAGVRPYLRCLRPPGYPDYGVNPDTDEAAFPRTPEDLVVDPDLTAEEQTKLSFDGTWRLRVEQPVVSYLYQIRWRLPGDAPHVRIAGPTRTFRKLLLAIGSRLAASKEIEMDMKCRQAFGGLCRDIVGQLRALEDPEEKLVMAMFIYDSAAVAVRPVLSWRSWRDDPLPFEFTIPLGGGIAGAAFQQRRSIAWSEAATEISLIRPEPHPDSHDLKLRNVLALPVYHDSVKDDRQPPPSGAIGVVTIGSSSDASPVAALTADNGDAQERRNELRRLAQTRFEQIREILAKSPPSAFGHHREEPQTRESVNRYAT